MATPTVSQIKAILDAGNYPDNSITSENIFDFVRPRKRYPSIEIEVVKPTSQQQDEGKTAVDYRYAINVFSKILGLGSDEMTVIRDIEDEVVSLLDAAVLGDHKIIQQDFDWKRGPVDAKHPRFYVSTLNLSIRRITSVSGTPDGQLTYIDAGSEVSTPLGTDKTYINVFNTEITEGFNDHDEVVTSNPDGVLVPLHFPGSFKGRFITHVHVHIPDVDGTSEKLNQMQKLHTNGFKQIFHLKYIDKTTDTPLAPGTITEDHFVEIDEIVRLYQVNDVIRYRIIGKLDRPGTVSVS